jgi:Omp85 superfamily domain
MLHTKATARAVAGLSLTLVVVLTASVIAGAQTATSSPAREKNEAPTEQTSSESAAQTTAKPSSTTAQPDAQTDKPKKPKRGQLIIAPIPITSPAVGAGLVLVAGYVFKLNQEDKLSPPSTVGLVGAFTSSGSRGGGIGGRLYFKENKYQTSFALAKGRVNFDFFGIGLIPGREPISVPLKVGGTVFFGEFLRNVGHDIFIGPRYQRRNLYARLDGIQTPGGFQIPPTDLQAVSAALGFHVQRDKRDSGFYPTKGSLFDVKGDFFAKALGSRRQYQTYKLSYNGYHQLAPKQILAYRGMICSANQSVPFYDLCLYGSADLRGYTSGEFQNRRMFATQAEYRRELKGRFGMVAFGGVGGIANKWNAFRSDELLPAAGAGFRFKLDKKNHINYRIDFAVGRAGRTLSIGIGEAF